MKDETANCELLFTLCVFMLTLFLIMTNSLLNESPGALSPQEMEGCHACLCVLNDMNLLLHSLQVQMNQLLQSTISITTSKIKCIAKDDSCCVPLCKEICYFCVIIVLIIIIIIDSFHVFHVMDRILNLT